MKYTPRKFFKYNLATDSVTTNKAGKKIVTVSSSDPAASNDTGEGYMMADAVNFTGDLIESWEIEDDGVTMHLKVRQGMTFRDTGDEVTADDLLAWIERSFRSHAAGEWILNTGQVHSTDQVTITGPHEMTIKLSAATPLFGASMRPPNTQITGASDSSPSMLDILTVVFCPPYQPVSNGNPFGSLGGRRRGMPL